MLKNKSCCSPHEQKEFLTRLTKITEANLSNDQFGVSELARELGMSRSFIHKRLKSYTRQSVSQFIRSVRLKKAMNLLRQQKSTAAEIAYEVGFGSPTYFNHCFHERYGFPPGEVKKWFLKEGSEKNEDFNENSPESNYIEDDIAKPASINDKFFSKKNTRRLASLLVILSMIWFLYYFYTNDSFTFFENDQKSKELSIFVSPFENLSNIQETQYIADGIREDIIHDLYRITTLKVASQISVEPTRGLNIAAIKNEQKVEVKYVLEGSIRIYNEEIRISIRLIDTQNEDYLWVRNFERRVDDILGVQDEIALEVASNVKAMLSEDEIRQIKKIPTQNAKAYNYYLQGRFLLHKANNEQRYGFDKAGVKNCIQYYEKAIEEDKDFAEAYAGLASAWFKLSAWGWKPKNEGFPKAKKLCLEALEIDPNCAEAHSILAAYYTWGQRNFQEGAKEYITSIELNQNFASARQGYAQFLMITGPIDEARRQIDIALTLEPYFWVVQNVSAWIYYFEDKHDRGIETCMIAQDLKPDFIENEWLFFLNYAKSSQGGAAMEMLQKIIKHHPEPEKYIDEIQSAYENDGIDGLFYWLIEVNKNRPIPLHGLTGHPFFIAWWNAILGKKEETIYWLERNMESNKRLYVYFNLIATNPDFLFLHNDPRFLKIVDEIGLSAYLK